MGLFFKAEQRVRQKIADYLCEVDACMDQFGLGMEYHLQRDGGEAKPDEGRTDDLESRADDLRRDIEMTLYGRALLPESRGDILTILEAFDRVPNAAETVISILHHQRIVIPEEFRAGFRKLLDKNMEAYRTLRRTIDTLFENPRQTPYLVREVGVKETEADAIEAALIARIFDSDLDKADMIQLKDVAATIGNLADRAENAADRMAIVAIKRRV